MTLITRRRALDHAPKIDHRVSLSTMARMQHSKVLAGAAVLVFFGVFFAFPVYAAMTLCTMPCCANTGTAISSGMTECATTCAIRADQATPSRATTFAPEQRVSAYIHVSSTASAVEPPVRHAIAIAGRSDETHRGAPVHLLNSLFRI